MCAANEILTALLEYISLNGKLTAECPQLLFPMQCGVQLHVLYFIVILKALRCPALKVYRKCAAALT